MAQPREDYEVGYLWPRQVHPVDFLYRCLLHLASGRRGRDGSDARKIFYSAIQQHRVEEILARGAGAECTRTENHLRTCYECRERWSIR